MIKLGTLEIPPTRKGSTPYWYEEIKGWFDLAPDKSSVRERPQSHGAFNPARVLRAGLGITVKMHCVTESLSSLLAVLSQMAAAGVEKSIVMAVDEHARWTERVVRVRKIEVDDYHARPYTTITLDLFAPDPRRYATAAVWESAAARPVRGSGLVWPARWPLVWRGTQEKKPVISLTNGGVFPSPPVIRMYGGFTAAEVVNVATQQRVRLDWKVDAGTYAELDFRLRRALIQGTSDVSRYLTRRQWWDIPPSLAAEGGSPTQIFFRVENPAGDPWFSGEVKSAW